MIPNIPTFTPADYRDNDTYSEDCTAEMLNRQTTISSVALGGVFRSDGVPTSSADYTVSNISVLAGNLKYAWKGSGGIPSIIYYVKFILTLASTDTIERTVAIPVPQYVG